MRIFSPEGRVGPIQVTLEQEREITRRLNMELKDTALPTPLAITSGAREDGQRNLQVDVVVADTTSGVQYAEIGKPVVLPPDIHQRIEKIFAEVANQ